MMAAGHNNTTIAAHLTLAPKTVRNHISKIMTKLHLQIGFRRLSERVRSIEIAVRPRPGLARRPPSLPGISVPRGQAAQSR